MNPTVYIALAEVKFEAMHIYMKVCDMNGLDLAKLGPAQVHISINVSITKSVSVYVSFLSSICT